MRNYYQCADDRWIMLTLTPPTRFWSPFCRAMERPELEHDPRYDQETKRQERSEELVALFDGIFATRTREEWLSIFSEYDLFCAGVNTLLDLQHDPQILANDYLVDFEHPTMGLIKIPGYPIHFSDSQAGTISAAPDLGEHTEEVLTEIGGYSEAEISVFRKKGII